MTPTPNSHDELLARLDKEIHPQALAEYHGPCGDFEYCVNIKHADWVLLQRLLSDDNPQPTHPAPVSVEGERWTYPKGYGPSDPQSVIDEAWEREQAARTSPGPSINEDETLAKDTTHADK